MKNRIVINFLLIVALISNISCNRVEKDWNIANATNTIAAYTEFINNHPKSEYVVKAKTSMENIYLKDAVEYVVASFIQSTGNLMGFSNVKVPELSSEEKKRLDAIGVTDFSFSCQGDIQSQYGSGAFNIPSNGFVEAMLKGNVHHKIRLGEGNYSIENGMVVISEGSKIAINGNNYFYEGERLNDAK